jgi:hypothetical protein
MVPKGWFEGRVGDLLEGLGKVRISGEILLG